MHNPAKKPFGHRLLDVSLRSLWKIISSPGMFPVFFKANRICDLGGVVRYFFPEVSPDDVERVLLGFLRNHHFFAELNERMLAKRGRRANCEGLPELLYCLVRFAKPLRVVETGTFDGISTAVILQALLDNDKGHLVSIDLPAVSAILESTHRMRETSLPQGCAPAWVVPDYLRPRHSLVLGDSKKLLEDEIDKIKGVDLFFHDSLHTYEHQKFEYETAWPEISAGGLLVSDDVLWTPAFYRFARRKGKYAIYQGFGILHKS